MGATAAFFSLHATMEGARAFSAHFLLISLLNSHGICRCIDIFRLFSFIYVPFSDLFV